MGPSFMSHCNGAVGAALGVSLTVLGCNLLESEVDESDIRLHIEVARPYYSVQADSLIRVRLLNEGRHPVYTRTSLPYVVLERWVEGQWEELPLWYGWLALVPLPVWDVAPGDSVINMVTVGDEVFRSFGRYRFRYQLFLDRNLQRPMSLAGRVSTEFIIGE